MENKVFSRAFFSCPLGLLEIRADEKGVVSVLFSGGGRESDDKVIPVHLKEALRQLKEYFSGHREGFDFPMNIKGTAWQKKVWRELLKIPCGKTASYSQLAEKLGGKEKARAVASACAQNKLMLAIPCHRVIGVDGELKGYAGGFRHKRWLLDFEKKN
jgi:methylated-DNA-[protein]-cysteine S-methyltransferase